MDAMTSTQQWLREFNRLWFEADGDTEEDRRDWLDRFDALDARRPKDL